MTLSLYVRFLLALALVLAGATNLAAVARAMIGGGA